MLVYGEPRLTRDADITLGVSDVVIHKILAGRPRDLEDVRHILRKQTLDAAYIQKRRISMAHKPQTYRYFLLTLDPVHIGTGGTRLGRVDLDIVREVGTRLPKIPGSSLHGMIRAYAAYRYGKPQCAGQGQQEGRRHCGQPTCPICYTFGFARDKAGGRAGVVAISDARILLFPVYSMVGPVWVSTVNILQEAGFQVQRNGNNISGAGPFATFERQQPLNLGWLMVETPTQVTIIAQAQTATQAQNNLWGALPEPIRNRVVLVSDKLFFQIVNSNLEVRTSVAINPETGAAEEGALFTYEAIPRATVLWMDVVVSDYQKAFPSKEIWEQICQNAQTLDEEMSPAETEAEKALRNLGYIPERPQRRENETDEQFRERQKAYWKQVCEAHEACRRALASVEWKTPLDIVSLGLEWAEHLGVGGMGTRGFGRIRVLNPYRDTEQPSP